MMLQESYLDDKSVLLVVYHEDKDNFSRIKHQLRDMFRFIEHDNRDGTTFYFVEVADEDGEWFPDTESTFVVPMKETLEYIKQQREG